MFQDAECLVWLGFQLVIFIVTGLFLACKARVDYIKTRFFYLQSKLLTAVLNIPDDQRFII